MPKPLQSLTTTQVQVANEQRPVSGPRVSGDDPVARALTDAGRDAFDFTSRVRQAHIDAEVVNGEIELQKRLDDAYRELEKDTTADPGEFGKRFDERSKEIVGELAGAMNSPAHRRQWEAVSQQSVAKFGTRVKDLSMTRYQENAIAVAMEAGSKYNDVANDPSRPREMLDHAANQYDALIKSQLDQGLYTRDQAEKLMLESKSVRAEGVSLRHVSNLEAMMEQGRYGEAKQYLMANGAEITPASRESADKAIRIKGREYQSIQRADALMDKAGGDYGKALDGARDIEDIDQRLAVEDRIRTMAAQDEAAKSETQDRVKEELLGHVLSGGNLANAPSRAVADADAFTLNYIEDEIRQRQEHNARLSTLSAQEKAAVKEASAIGKDALGAYRALQPELYMLGPENWETEAPAMYAAYSKLVPEHRSEISEGISKARAEGRTFDAADAVLSDLVKQVPMLGPSNMRGEDFDGNSKSKKKVRAEEDVVRASLYRQAQEYATRTGGADITPADSKIMIARAFREADSKRYPFVEPGAFVNPLIEAIMDTPKYEGGRNYLRQQLGREPTPEEVLKAVKALEE